MTGPRIGELFAGYGGLGMGVKAAIGGEVAWVSEIDKGACKVLAHRYPDAPNLGDITTVDWSQVEPVDVLTGGFPCQDVSTAGKRAGMRPGTRSGLWQHFAYVIDQLRPPLVVIENVRGLLSAQAHSDVEPCPWCLGDDPGGVMRALGAVLADLADLGYDAEWCGLRAADVGGCHERFRVFIVAHPAGHPWRLDNGDRGAAPDASDVGHERGWQARRRGPGPTDGRLLPTPVTEPQTGNGHARNLGDEALLPTPRATDGTNGGPNQRGSSGDLMLPSAVAKLLPTPTAKIAGGTPEQYQARFKDGRRSTFAPLNMVAEQVASWGDYADAIARWEYVLGRPAPPPTETSPKTGRPRLSPRFEEWMMGLPDGWITDTPEVTWAEAVRMCGNGVVLQQAEAAVRWLLDVAEAAA